jgi:hypothetical protein
MNLIDRYVYAVIRRLPAGQREPIEKELRTRIDHLLMEGQKSQPAPEERKNESPQEEPDESAVRAVLEELGNPAVLARAYHMGHRYIIGPALYDTYFFVLKIVLGASLIGLLVANGIRLIAEPVDHTWTAFGLVLGSLYQGLLSAFAIVTLIFILVEYFGKEEIKKEIKIEVEKDSWSLDDLPEIPSEKLRIKRGEPIAAVIFTLIFLVIINVFPQLIGFYQQSDDGLRVFAFLGEGFLRLLPYINIALVLGLALEAIKIIYGRWTGFLIIGSVFQNIFSFVVSLRVIRDDQFINPEFVTAIDQFLAKAQSDSVIAWQNPLITVLTALVVFGFIVEILTLAVKGYHLIRSTYE